MPKSVSSRKLEKVAVKIETAQMFNNHPEDVYSVYLPTGHTPLVRIRPGSARNHLTDN
jgi:hypothetical protein